LPTKYLQLQSRQPELKNIFDSLSLAPTNTERLTVPKRNVKPVIIRAIVRIVREQCRLDVGYVSVYSPNREGRVPHSLAFTAMHRHVRPGVKKWLL